MRRLHLTQKAGANFRRLFWRCPKAINKQCEFFHAMVHQSTDVAEGGRRWTPPMKIYDKDPVEIVENIQARCTHPRTSRSGTNAFKKILRCTSCGLILQEELTELGLQKQANNPKKK